MKCSPFTKIPKPKLLLLSCVLSFVMCDWDMAIRVYNNQCSMMCNCGRRCRGALSCLWVCVAMYSWDAVSSMCTIRGRCGGHDVCRCSDPMFFQLSCIPGILSHICILFSVLVGGLVDPVSRRCILSAGMCGHVCMGCFDRYV